MTAALAIFWRIWAVVWPILKIAIPVPVFVVLLVLAWWQFDKTSSVRRAVNSAVTELVAGAELNALKAQLAAEHEISKWNEERAEDALKQAAAEQANRISLEGQLQLTAAENKENSDELAALKASPVSGDCTVDQRFYDGLRNK